jgi:hypothetical protein
MEACQKNKVSSDEASKLIRITLRYHPPGLTLIYTDSYGKKLEKSIDLLDLQIGTDVDKLGKEILNSVQICPKQKFRQKLTLCLEKLKERCYFDYSKKYVALTLIKPHSLPLTDACISRDGMK